MISRDSIFVVIVLAGFALLIFGAVFSNIAVFQMAKEWNSRKTDDERIPPWAVIGKGASSYKIVPKYRELFGDGPLYQQLKFAYWMCGVGFVLAIGPILLSKIVGI